MQDHINKIQAMRREIAAAGKVISSKDMAIILFCQLPDSYNGFYSSLITLGRRTDLSWEELVPMVLDQQDRFRTTFGGRGVRRLISLKVCKYVTLSPLHSSNSLVITQAARIYISLSLSLSLSPLLCVRAKLPPFSTLTWYQSYRLSILGARKEK